MWFQKSPEAVSEVVNFKIFLGDPPSLSMLPHTIISPLYLKIVYKTLHMMRMECNCQFAYSIYMYNGVKLLWWLWGAITQWSEHLQLKHAGGPGFYPQQLPWIFFFSPSWLTNVDGMKDLWCSSAIRLLSTQIWVNAIGLSTCILG